MKATLFKQFLLLSFTFVSLFILAQNPDKVTLNSIKVNGISYNSSSTLTLYKGVPVALTVNYTIQKYTPSYTQPGNTVEFSAKLAAGSWSIGFDNQMWPSEQYVSKRYEFTAHIPTTTPLIERNNTGRLYLTYSYGASKSSSNLINVKFIEPVVSNNTISNGIVTNYLTKGSTIVGSNVSVPTGSYKIYWQRKNKGHWYNINGGTVNTHDYTPPASENKYHYKVRRLVKPTSPAIKESYSNEVDVRVNIGENSITESNEYNSLIGSEPKGGTGDAYRYKWQEKINGIWTDIANATKRDFSIPPLSVNRTFRRIVNSEYVAESISNEIEVKPRIIGNSIALNFNHSYSTEHVLFGEKPIFNFLRSKYITQTTGTHPISYQWQRKTRLGEWTDIVGVNSEFHTINYPLYETTDFRRLANSLHTNTSESNIITITVSNNSKTENNIISFNPSDDNHILGTIPTGGNGDYTYMWGLDVHPDDSIGEIIDWGISKSPETFISDYLMSLPIISDEYRIVRYAISDNVWHKSNTLIYSLTRGIIQGKKTKQTQLLNSQNKKEVIVFTTNNELNFTFKNYKDILADIYVGSLATGRTSKITTFNIKNNIDSYVWKFPSNHLSEIYVYQIIFNDGTVQSGKVILK